MTKSFIMKCMALILLGAGLLVGPSTVQAAGTGKIGFVNIDEVSAKANLVKNMLSTIEAGAVEKQKSLEAKQAEYARLSKDLKAKSAVASESELQGLRKQARDILNQIDEETYQLNQYLKRAEKERMDPATDRVLATIKTVGTEEGFDLILRGETILYGAPAVDLTQKVIERLNRDAVSGGSKSSAVPADESANTKDNGAASDATNRDAATDAPNTGAGPDSVTNSPDDSTDESAAKPAVKVTPAPKKSRLPFRRAK